jgi:hypothetical protein
VSIALVAGPASHGGVVELIVPLPPGIVAVNDGGAWAGVAGVLLPFSE